MVGAGARVGIPEIETGRGCKAMGARAATSLQEAVVTNADRRLEAAVALGIISEAQAEAIRGIAPDRSEVLSLEAPRALNAASLAYVLGALIVVVAMAWFLADRWNWLGAGGVLAVCALYSVVFLFTARRLRRDGYSTASGLVVLLTVGLVAPATLASNELLHWFTPEVGAACGYPDYVFWTCRGEEFVVELATAAAALFALRQVRFSLLVLPLAAIASRMLFHFADIFFRNGWRDATNGWVWVIGASALAAVAYTTDRRQKGDEDFARWLHIAAAFSALMAAIPLLSAYPAYRHLLVPVAFVAFAAALSVRRFAWMALGLGFFCWYLVWLASDVFKDTPAFPIVLAALGVAVIVATVQVQRDAERLVQRFGVVSSDGRPRFPGGVPLLLTPALLAVLMLPDALALDRERREEERWRTAQWGHRTVRERLEKERTRGAVQQETPTRPRP